MVMNRRSFFKIMGVAGASLLVSLGLQNSGVNRVKAEKSLIPGAGDPPLPVGANPDDPAYRTDVDKIDSDAFIGLCVRCGVCINVCPFQAIKSKEIFYPTLTRETRPKCPGYEICGVCHANCPTDALPIAFKPLGGVAGVDKSQLWDGPTPKNERDVIARNR
jgi:ferredoxin